MPDPTSDPDDDKDVEEVFDCSNGNENVVNIAYAGLTDAELQKINNKMRCIQPVKFCSNAIGVSEHNKICFFL